MIQRARCLTRDYSYLLSQGPEFAREPRQSSSTRWQCEYFVIFIGLLIVCIDCQNARWHYKFIFLFYQSTSLCQGLSRRPASEEDF